MIDKVKKLLKTKFEHNLFDSAIYNLKDKKNKLRYNNFAYSIRELSRHFLNRLAPDKNVKECNWFKVETDNGKPTRTQRIKYAIQGGITDEMLSNYGFDTEQLKIDIKSIKKTIDSLSKYTHINEDTFDINEEKIKEESNNVLSKFILFNEQIEALRKKLNDFLEGQIEEHMIKGVISNYYSNVDILAPHHSIDYSEIFDYKIIEINQNKIIVEVSGNINFILEYGSRKEREEGDGLELPQTFSFTTKIIYEINSDFPSQEYKIEEFDVNTDEWYE